MEGGTSDISTTYLNAIQSIRLKGTNENLHYKSFDIKHIAAKYSNTKKPIYKIVIDDTPISRNNSLLIKYKCMTCDIQQEISLNLYVRKINNGSVHCSTCVNTDATKRATHSTFMKDNFSEVMSGEHISTRQAKKTQSLNDYITMSETDWNNEDDDYHLQYFNIHLTVEEFNNIKSKIKGVNNMKLTALDNWEYYPTYRIFNQTRYTPMLINKSDNIVEKPYYITFNCDNCDCEFTHRDLEIVKNKLKVFCKECSLTNKTFRIRKLTLNDGSSIVWQSQPEKRFILWCQERNIKIVNGPKIPYKFNEKDRTYKVDFELPDLKLIIEIKDNHCWYKEQIQSGKQPAKENAAINWCNENNYKYYVMFPKTSATIKDMINELCKI